MEKEIENGKVDRLLESRMKRLQRSFYWLNGIGVIIGLFVISIVGLLAKIAFLGE